MSSIEEEISSVLGYPEILLYGLFKSDVEVPQSVFYCNNIEPKRPIKGYSLEDELGVLNGNVLILFAIKLDKIPNEIELYLGAILDKLTEAGALCSWLMFDLAFDFRAFLTNEVSSDIYGLKIANKDTQFALTSNIRLSKSWAIAVNEARDYLISNKYINQNVID